MPEPRCAAPIDDAPLTGVRALIVEARYYEDLADALLAGATRALEAAGAQVQVVTVPGALELPLAMQLALDAVAGRRPFDLAVALGCVIRGETGHYDIVAGESARGLMNVSLARGIAFGNGVLTVENEAQAWARARPEEGDKGGGAARAALNLVRLSRGLRAGACS